MEVQDFMNMPPEQRQTYLDQLNTHIQIVKGLQEVEASIEKREREQASASRQQPMKYYHAASSREEDNSNRLTKAYNLMSMITGCGPQIPVYDNAQARAQRYRYYQAQQGQQALKLHASSVQGNKADAEKVRKTYELIHVLIRG